MPSHAAIGAAARHHHRAGTAITLAAAFLRSGQAFRLPQPVQQRGITGEAADLLDLVVENECDPVTHRLCPRPPLSAAAVG